MGGGLQGDLFVVLVLRSSVVDRVTVVRCDVCKRGRHWIGTLSKVAVAMAMHVLSMTNVH